MAKLEEGQTAEYWWKRAEQYRKTLGGVTNENRKLKQKLSERDAKIAELRELLWIGYSRVPEGDENVEAWRDSVKKKLKGDKV